MGFEMAWTVKVKKSALKQVGKIPVEIQGAFFALVEDLKANGPHPGPDWKNYSKLSKIKHHCHLAYKWVACWEVENDQLKIMEVYYVGSRENAPY